MADLFYVIGASGVGKDSLLNYARTHLKPGTQVVFAHRYITRPHDAGGENHIALSPSEFELRKQTDCFAMQWHSHRIWYGIGVEIDHWLSRGLSVVVNGSREYLDEASRIYSQLKPVLITANYQILRKRLQERGRERPEQIERRLQSASALDQKVSHKHLQRIANDGPLEQAGSQLLDLIQQKEPRACA